MLDLREKLLKLKKTLAKKRLAHFIPLTYIRLLLVGFVMAGFFVFFPNLAICPFGPDLCMPIGVLVVFAASFPGYFLVSAISTRIQLSELVMLTILILFSLLFYFILGLLIDKHKNSRQRPASLIKLTIFITFLILVVLLLLFI